MKNIETQNLPEAEMLSARLDYYKPTMSQHWHAYEPDATVTFRLQNRDAKRRIADYVSVGELQTRLDELAERGWQEPEVAYLGSLTNNQGERVFGDDYLQVLRTEDLPPARVRLDPVHNDIAVETTGESPLATFWETVAMSEVNETYFANYMRAHNIDPADVYAEGDRRLSEKIDLLRQNPHIKFADFGTRRRFSLASHRHVVERLSKECPENFLGTSNVALANTLGLEPIGTFAHEMPMVYAGLADARGQDIRASHNRLMQDWYDHYGADLSIALTDTFGSEFFFEDFTAEQAAAWRGARQDSGSPLEWGNDYIRYNESKNVDPLSKLGLFSDSLDVPRMLAIGDYFKGRLGVAFGWGTNATNDLGLQPLNIVMKATHVRTADGLEADTVKLSDDPGKHTGPPEKIKEYQHVFGKLATTVA